MKRRMLTWMSLGLVACLSYSAPVPAHIIPAEKLHPVAESYRRICFILNLNPVRWDQIKAETVAIGNHSKAIGSESAGKMLADIEQTIAQASVEPNEEKGIEPLARQQAAAMIFESIT